MTDPDRRDITDQRFHDDAALRYLTAIRPARTHAEWLAYFHEQFAGSYIVTAPRTPGGYWRASAIFGNNEQLFGLEPAGLLTAMRARLRTCDRDHGQHGSGQSGSNPEGGDGDTS